MIIDNEVTLKRERQLRKLIISERKKHARNVPREPELPQQVSANRYPPVRDEKLLCPKHLKPESQIIASLIHDNFSLQKRVSRVPKVSVPKLKKRDPSAGQMPTVFPDIHNSSRDNITLPKLSSMRSLNKVLPQTPPILSPLHVASISLPAI